MKKTDWKILNDFYLYEYQCTNVQRHHHRRHSKPESVAEHQWVTAMLALKLMPDLSREALLFALTHDVGEIAVGDVPKTTKDMLGDLRLHLATLEDEFNVFSYLKFKITPEEYQVVKHADQLSYALFARAEAESGNKYFSEVWEKLNEER